MSYNIWNTFIYDFLIYFILCASVIIMYIILFYFIETWWKWKKKSPTKIHWNEKNEQTNQSRWEFFFHDLTHVRNSNLFCDFPFWLFLWIALYLSIKFKINSFFLFLTNNYILNFNWIFLWVPFASSPPSIHAHCIVVWCYNNKMNI